MTDRTIDETTMRRIRAAAHTAAVNRFELEFVWPECHKAKCSQQHGDPGQALALLEHAVIESVENELRFETVTRPDLADPEDTAEQTAVLTLATLLSTYNVRDAGTFVRAAQLMIDAYPPLTEALAGTTPEGTLDDPAA